MSRVGCQRCFYLVPWLAQYLFRVTVGNFTELNNKSLGYGSVVAGKYFACHVAKKFPHNCPAHIAKSQISSTMIFDYKDKAVACTGSQRVSKLIPWELRVSRWLPYYLYKLDFLPIFCGQRNWKTEKSKAKMKGWIRQPVH